MPAKITTRVPMGVSEGAKNVAIIFGVTGLAGREIARSLVSSESPWKVYGIARNPEIQPIITMKSCNPYNFISCDLLNPLETHKNLSPLHDVTHVFWVTWASQFPLDSQQCCEQNKTMMSNALNTIIMVAKNLKHVSLQTGTKHYISLQAPFEQNQKLHYYYHEQAPRIASKTPNFYYALEDLLMEKLNGNNKVFWSVHRPGLLLGSSTRSFYNFIGSLCVYGTFCKHLKIPFVFGGTRKCWEESYIDGSDSRLVAEQHIWAATKQDTACCRKGEAFNAINGSSFTWKEIWPILGKNLGAYVPEEEEEMIDEGFWYCREMGDEKKKKKLWEEIVEKHGLVKTKMEDLANWEFLDALFRFPVKLLVSRDKADGFGFVKRCNTLNCILYWIDCMREQKLIPRLDY
ncbi:(S)-8-oxocitronellyl enol synthase CYC2 [Prosopis cineraria]|uniref:(S)-8-oxocitronellyl enol synthase CYC2 n=1 Tax=Prosopis cineraria TaxID=364024 RepID=UPI00240F570F|nr:(S)-8-oxocitronellyl enol synthase CYC2 [Prosopis cineraria]